MKKLWIIASMALLMQGCGQEDPGKINIKLKFDSSVDATMKDSIKKFAFVIGKSGTSNAILYPSSCLVCPDGSKSCASSSKCYKKSCGFSTSEKTFDPEIDFSDIASGQSMKVVSCALDSSSAAVSGGSGTVKNTGGESSTITMTSDITACTTNLPPVCS